MNKNTVSIFIAAATLTLGVAFADEPIKNAIQDVRTTFYDAIDKDTSTVSFDAGKAVVSASEKENLAAIVRAVKSDTRVKKVIVASWSDREYPASQTSDLPKADRKLADSRNVALSKALSDLGLSNIETHSMAEHPSWLSKVFNTKDSKLKGEGKVKDVEDQMTAEVGKTLRNKGGPGKAVVILIRAVDLPVN